MRIIFKACAAANSTICDQTESSRDQSGRGRTPLVMASANLIQAFLATTILSSGLLADPAQAQLTSQIPGIDLRSTKDENGVDLVTGSFSEIRPTLEFGDFANSRLFSEVSSSYYATELRDNFSSLIATNVEGGITYVYVALGNERFKFRKSGSTYSPVDGNGATLAHVDGTAIYTLTKRDGTTAELSYQSGASLGDAECPGSGDINKINFIKYPDGELLKFYYKNGSRTIDPEGPNCQRRFRARLQSATSSYGFQLKYVYASNTMSGSASNEVAFTSKRSITAINNKVDYCDPNADSCSYSKSWPIVTFTKDSEDGPLSGSSVTTYTDPQGTTFSVFRQVKLAGVPAQVIVYKPNSTVAETTVDFTTYSGVEFVSSLTNGGQTWNYSHVDTGGDLLPRIHAIGKLARQMETSDAAKPIYRGSDHWGAAGA